MPDPLATEQILTGRVRLHRHAIGRAAGQLGRKSKGAVGTDTKIVTAVVLQHHRPGQPRNRATHREGGTVRAGDGHVGDVGGGDGARAVGNRAGLTGRVGLHRHAVGRAAGQRGSEGERAVCADAEIVTTVILQHHRPRQPRNGAADRISGPAGGGPARPVVDLPGADRT